MVRHEAQTTSSHLKDRGVVRIAQPRRRLDQCIEYFLHIERRSADDLQNISSGSLLLEGLAQLVEKAGVLDGDDGLVCKALDERDLLVGKWSNLLAVNDNHADQFILLEHRHCDVRLGSSQ